MPRGKRQASTAAASSKRPRAAVEDRTTFTLQALPFDLIKLIACEEERALLRLVSKALYQRIPVEQTCSRKVAQFAVNNGYTSLLEWVLDGGYVDTPRKKRHLADCAMRNARLSTLKLLVKRRVTDITVLHANWALRSGKADTLAWLYYYKGRLFPNELSALHTAMEQGHADAVIWTGNHLGYFSTPLIMTYPDSGEPDDAPLRVFSLDTTLQHAAAHLGLLKRLSRCFIGEATAIAAARGGHLDVLRWIHYDCWVGEHPSPTAEAWMRQFWGPVVEEFQVAAHYGNAAVLELLYDAPSTNVAQYTDPSLLRSAFRGYEKKQQTREQLHATVMCLLKHGASLTTDLWSKATLVVRDCSVLRAMHSAYPMPPEVLKRFVEAYNPTVVCSNAPEIWAWLQSEFGVK